MQEFTLNNGLKTLYYPIDTGYSIVISLNVNAGVFLENNENNGITHFLEHLHFRRLNDIDQNSLYYNMDRIGSNLNGRTYKELLRFDAKIRPNFFEDALLIFQKLLTAYMWTDNDILCEKQIVLNEIREKKNFFDFDTLIHNYIFKDTPYSMPIIGRCKTISNITKENVIQYKKQIFSKENTSIVITGKINYDDIIKSNKLFENIKLSDFDNNSIKNRYLKYNIKHNIKIFNEDLDYPCAALCFSIDNSISNSEVILLNSILGEGTGSLLEQVIREKLGLSYNIYSYIENYAVSSLLNIFFSFDYENIYECLINIINILNNLKIKISNRDMKTNMPYYTDNMWYLFENNELLNENLSWDAFSDKKIKTVEEKIFEYKQINKEGLAKTANKIFNIENCIFIAAGKFRNINVEKIENIINGL